MKSFFILTFYLVISISSKSQVIPDTIITNQFDTIPCKITYVNPYTVFYKIKKRKKLKDRLIPRIDIEQLIVNQSSVKVPEQKVDEGINAYFRKSKLNRSYESLMLDHNEDPSLKILADSTFSSKTLDYLYIGSMIQSFANRYKCKLIYVSNISKADAYSVNIKLYDASDDFYQKTSEKYDSKEIYFLRTNNNSDLKQLKFKYKNNKVTLEKNDYYVYTPSPKDSIESLGVPTRTYYGQDTIIQPANLYYYIGNAHFYSDFKMTGSVVVGYVLGGILGGIIMEGMVTEKTRLNNFIGEFIILNLDSN